MKKCGPAALGDANNDGAVDVVDLGTLARNYDWVGTPAGAVPEPMTLSLLAAGLLGLIRLKRYIGLAGNVLTRMGRRAERSARLLFLCSFSRDCKFAH